MNVFTQDQEEDGEEDNASVAAAAAEAQSHLYQRRVYVELKLQDNKVTSASKMMRSMKTLFSLARRGGLVEQMDVWELRIDELESIAYAQSFFTGKAGMSSTKMININQRANQCYKAAKKLKRSSVFLVFQKKGPQRKRYRKKILSSLEKISNL